MMTIDGQTADVRMPALPLDQLPEDVAYDMCRDIYRGMKEWYGTPEGQARFEAIAAKKGASA